MSDAPQTTFADLGLTASLVGTLSTLGYEAPTPIQSKTIPALLQGKDIIGQAQTGTGKTAAFALPILQQLDPSVKQTQALVLAPTRELAMQVAEAIHSYARGMAGVTVLPVYGGAPIVLQMKHLARGAQIVVGTPGRLIDHLDRETLSLEHVKMVVLDEADEMLKMGFIDEVERMLSLVPTPRQIALFSATMPDEVMRIAKRHLVNAVHVEIEHHGVSAPAIEQRFINLSEGQKLEVLTQILELEPSEAALIFRRTKTGAAELAERLEARGFSAVAMHGDMNQSMRENVIRRLRAGQIEIVVATDVAARGLDVEQISHVINYDIPYDVEAYVHRIGRTGRAGRTGVATLFITPRERRMMREIERYTGTQIKPMKIPTNADVAARRIEVFKDTLRKALKEDDLDLYVSVVQQVADEGPHDMAEVAAAAARLANGSKSLAAVPERRVEPEVTARPRTSAPSAGRFDGPPVRKARPESGSFVPRAPRDGDDERPERTMEGKVRLSMAVGKRDGIRPADIVGSIANEADVPGRDIGPIDIQEEMTYVVVPERFVDQVLEKVGRAKFRGRAVDIKVAGEGAPPMRSHRPSTPNTERSRSYEPRSEPRNDPRKPYKPSGERSSAPPAGKYPRADHGAAPRPDRDRPFERTGPRKPFSPAGPRRAAGPSDRPGYTPYERPSRPFDRPAPGKKPFFAKGGPKKDGPGSGPRKFGPKKRT